MKKQKPINLNFLTIWFPISAICSIFHRISGVLIFISLGVLLWLLKLSLSSPKGFEFSITIMHYFFIKLIIWIILTALTYHIICGIRHMMMDFRYLPETLQVGINSAKLVFCITIIISVIFGVIIW